MKKVIFLLAAGFLVACSALTPEQTIEKYTQGLKDGKYIGSLWDLEKFAKLYYAEYWDKAEQTDRDKMLSIIEQTSQNFAKMNQVNVAKSEIKSIKRVEENDRQVKLAVLYVRANDPKVSLELTFLLEKSGKSWKIINIEKISTPMGGVIDPLFIFKQNLPTLMKDLGYEAKELNLKAIAQFFEEKFIKLQPPKK